MGTMQPIVRLATIDDAKALVDLRTEFLAEVTASGGEAEVVAALTAYFTRALKSGEFVAYVAEIDNRIVATSGMVFHRHPPSPTNLHGCEAYVMNMYTLPAWRERGIAAALLGRLIELARQTHCCRVSLHALPAARSIYVEAGFVPVDTEMRLDLLNELSD